MEREEFKETSRKAEEDLSIIKAVMERTKCDMCEISNYFIWAGIIYILTDIFYIVAMRWIVVVTADNVDSIVPLSVLAKDMLHCILLIIPFYFCYKIIRQKQNNISMSILLFWGIITILIPFFIGLTQCFSSMNMTIIIDANRYADNYQELYSIMNKLIARIRLTEIDYKAISYILGIFVIGLIADKRNIKWLGICTIVIYFAVESFIIWRAEDEIINFLTIFVFLIEYGSVLLLGVFLKLEGRKKIHGIT